jgi:uncharacterized protein YabE (DUF348 family)/3D (Asp-Asp-Asp) domain-containing protein
VLALAVVGFRLFPGRDVTVVQDGQSYHLSATFNPEEEALAAIPGGLGPGDQVIEGSGGRYLSLAIQRARPVTLTADGHSVSLRTQAATVGGALAEAGIEIGPGDRLYVDGQLTTERGPLQAAMTYASRTYPASSTSGQGATGELSIAVRRAVPMTVSFDGVRVEVMSAAATVQDLLADLGVTVREGDLVAPGLDAPVHAGTNVQLLKAQALDVTIDGVHQTLYTLAETVGEVLAVMGIELGPDDSVSPPAETPLVRGAEVHIRTTRTVNEVFEEPVQPPVVDEFDANSFSGDLKVIEGAPGLKRVTYAVTYKDGVATTYKPVVKTVVIREATPTRRIIGTKVRPTSGQAKPTIDVGGAPTVYRQKLTVTATWYNLEHGAYPPDSPHYGLTASGLFASWGTCATDPNYIPMFTKFYVPGYGWCTALDIGGLVKGYHVDLFYPNEVGDPGWGKQTVDIYIVD